MTRFTEGRQPASERAVRNGTGPGVPSFLRPQPEDRPAPTDLDLHFEESGPSFKGTEAKATENPAPQVPAAPGVPQAPVAQTQQQAGWAPSLAYRAVPASTPKPEDYEIAPGSFLSAGE
jgi:hypothetical protein